MRPPIKSNTYAAGRGAENSRVRTMSVIPLNLGYIGRPLGLHKKKVPTRALNTVGTKGAEARSSPGIKLWLFRRANPSFEGRPRGLWRVVAVTGVTATSSRLTSHAVDELAREPVMLRRPSMTSDECRRRAEEAQTLAAQTQDDWERELFQRIITQWHVLALHKKGKEEKHQD